MKQDPAFIGYTVKIAKNEAGVYVIVITTRLFTLKDLESMNDKLFKNILEKYFRQVPY
jgi:hypothetical protein